MTLSRRSLLAGGAAVVAAAAAGGGFLYEERRPPQVDAPVPRDRPAALVSGSFVSAARGGRATGWTVAYPPGADPSGLPVCLVLHGRGNDHRTAFAALHLDRYLAAVVHAGARPFALVAVDGGDHAYWHRRADGEDPQRMIVDEFLPLLARRRLAVGRFAVLGWSMGGYGALLLAEALGPARVAAVAADSPALWLRPGESAPGAFDDAADFRRHDVFAARARLAGIPVRLACGTGDPFYRATRTFAAAVPQLAGTVFVPGGHTAGFWRSTAGGQLRFLAAARY